MRPTTLIRLFTACLMVLGALFIFRGCLAQSQTTQTQTPPASPAPIYNPYPPGILPDDLNAEIARVLQEIAVIEGRAIQRWHNLPPPTLTGQPPILKDTGTEAVETLGELMQYDKNISPLRNQACASCHMPYVAFSGPIPSVNLTMIAYPGTVHFRAGKRQAQRYTYSPFFPVLQYNEEQGLFFGGNFWDSRATGYLIRNPDAEQAQHPPVDTQEMGFPDTACIAFRLSRAVYRPLFEEVWGRGSLDINFPAEMAGYNLFNGKGNCNSCHLDARSTTLTPNQTDTGNQPGGAPVFTCFGSANEGLPLNPRDAFYYQTTPDPFDFTPNPLGFGY